MGTDRVLIDEDGFFPGSQEYKKQLKQNADFVTRIRELEAEIQILRNASRKCYECDEFVHPEKGEQHGRSGWVHYDCMTDD